MLLDIVKWLAGIGLERYSDTFTDNDIDFDILRVRAEVQRLTGKGGGEDRAQETSNQAISIAQKLGSKSLELRASTRLARLLLDRGRRGEAHAALQPVLSGFSEGLDTPDLIDAASLLGY